MSYKVLMKDQVDHFMELGWVKLEQAYSEKDALAAQEVVWQHVESRGVLKNDRSTWTQAMVRMNENYDTPEFRRCKTERLTDAIEDLIGRGRWALHDKPIHWGWWPVNFFSGADRPWDVPTEAWHVDGIHYPQYLDSKEQGLLLLCLFSEIKPRGGGTLVVEGSHNVVANILVSHPEGLNVKDVNSITKQHPYFAKLTGSVPMEENENRIDFFMNQTYKDDRGFSLKVAETTGSPGDVIIGHPFLFHAASYNHSGIPRFMCNNQAPLIDSITLERNNPDEFTPLEISIRKGIVSGGTTYERSNK